MPYVQIASRDRARATLTLRAPHDTPPVHADVIMMIFSFTIGIWLLATNGFSLFVTLGVLATVGAYVFAAAIHGSLLRVLLTWVQYSMSIPLWTNVFSIYSITNLHDVSGGGMARVVEAAWHFGRNAMAQTNHSGRRVDVMHHSWHEQGVQDIATPPSAHHCAITLPASRSLHRTLRRCRGARRRATCRR